MPYSHDQQCAVHLIVLVRALHIVHEMVFSRPYTKYIPCAFVAVLWPFIPYLPASGRTFLACVVVNPPTRLSFYLFGYTVVKV